MKNKNKTYIFQQAKGKWRVVMKGERDPTIYNSKDEAKASLRGQQAYQEVITKMGHSEYRHLT